MESEEINEKKTVILRAALNFARLEMMNFHIDDEGCRVIGDTANQLEIQKYKIRSAAFEWLRLLTDTEDDAPPPNSE